MPRWRVRKRPTKAQKLACQKARLIAFEKRRRREEGGLALSEVKDEMKMEGEETSNSDQEEDEVFPPPPPKKIRLVISNGSNIAKVKVNVGEGPPLHSRPSNPFPSYCFVCVKRIPKRTRLTGEDFSGLLEMLEMGDEEAEELMTRLGREPERWIGLCSECLKAVREAVKIRREMKEELRKRQRLIVERMKGTELISFGGEVKGGDPTVSEETRFALESILQFVHSRDYDSLDGSSSKLKGQKKDTKNKTNLISRMPPPPPPISVSVPSHDYNDDMEDDLIYDDPLSPDTDQVQLPTPKIYMPQPNSVNLLPIRFLVPAQPPKPKQLLYCGLCGDNKAYLNQAQLQLHTNQAHRPPSPKMMMEGEEEDDDDSQATRKTDDDGLTTKSLDKKINAAATTANVSGGEEASMKDLAPLYDCPNCPEVKDYPLTRYAQHLAIHQRRPFKCSICSVFFPAADDLLEQHWRQKHPDQSATEKFIEVALDPGKIWRCGGARCLLLFPTENARDLHELSCDLFHKSLRLQKVPSKELSCSVCKKPFRTKDEWRLHRLLHHPDVDSKSCLYSDLSFSDKTMEGVEARNDPKMILHAKRRHKGELMRNNSSHYHPVLFEECEECGLVFDILKECHDHFKDKHNIPDKVYSCQFCKRTYSNRPTLYNHQEKKHFVEELVCEVCGESFKGEEVLVGHRLRMHDLPPEDTNKYPVLTCPTEGCQYKTVSKQKFNNHTRNTHGEPGKFKCKYCGKGFKTTSNLNEYHRIHENKKSKPYQCEICGNSFAVKNYLYIHKRLSHEGRIFPSTNRQKQRKRVPGGKGEGRKNTRVKAVDSEADKDQDKPDEQRAVEVAKDKEGDPKEPSSSPSAKEGN